MTSSERAVVAALSALEKADLTAARQLAEISLGDEEGRPSSWAKAHRCLALVHWREENLESCRDHFAQEASLLEEVKPRDTARLLAARDDVALLEYKIGRFGSSLAMRKESLDIAKNDPTLSASVLRRLHRRYAQSLQRHGDMDAAENAYKHARPAKEDSDGDKMGWHVAVALLAEQRGDIGTAAERYDDLIAFLNTRSDLEGYDEALANALLTRLDLGEDGEAASLLKQLHRAVSASGTKAGRLRLLDVRTLLLDRRSRYSAAAAVAHRADILMASLVGSDHEDLINRAAIRAAMLRGAKRRSEAKTLLYSRLPQQLTPAATAALVELGEMLVEDKAFDRARQTLERALAGEVGQQFAEAQWRILLALSDTLHEQDKTQAALLLGKMALEGVRASAAGLSGASRSKWLKGRMEAYERTLDRLSLAGRLPEAAELQMRRMQEMSREIGFSRPELDRTLAPVSYRTGEASFRKRFNKLQLSIKPRADASRAVSRWLNAISEQGFNRSVEVEPKTFAETTLWLLADKTHASVVVADPGGSYQKYPVPISVEEIARGIRSFRTAIAERSEDWLTISKKLRQAIFGLVTTDLQRLKRLDIVAPGVFAFLPFAALHDGNSFLVEQFELAMRTGQSLPRPNGRPDNWEIAAFGASAGRNNREPLPGVRAELSGLSSYKRISVKLDDEFTVSSLRHALDLRPHVLHLASHFHFRPAHPHLSSLELGDGSLLSIASLSGPDYDFSSLELLVLSACETGLSDSIDVGMDGIAGLAQAKGARAVIASLWKVPDAGTVQVMSGLYRELGKQDAADIPAALAASQRSLISTPPVFVSTLTSRGGIGGHQRLAPSWHPLDWAGFTVFVGGGSS